VGLLIDFITQLVAELFGRGKDDSEPGDGARATSKGPLVMVATGFVVLVVSLAVGASAVAAGAIVVIIVSAMLTRRWYQWERRH
jgi:hypothetical protein